MKEQFFRKRFNYKIINQDFFGNIIGKCFIKHFVYKVYIATVHKQLYQLSILSKK